jgi:hypothetical protein
VNGQTIIGKELSISSLLERPDNLQVTFCLYSCVTRKKENAIVSKKIGEHHQMAAKDRYFASLDIGEGMF